jgi:hypothetical protein
MKVSHYMFYVPSYNIFHYPPKHLDFNQLMFITTYDTVYCQ